jgi:hypothetical protein
LSGVHIHTSRRAILRSGLLLLLPVGLLAWPLVRGAEPTRPEEPASIPPTGGVPRAATPAESPLPVPSPPPRANPPRAATDRHEPDPGPDALLINPADPNAPRPDGGPLHPHPITPGHERIFRENQLIGALYGAMDVKDGQGVRRLAEQYRREYPEDPNQLQQGYDVIADCLEHSDAEARAAGQRYCDEARGSILRRFVARLCLGFEL